MPGCDPRTAYGDLYGRGVRGIVLEAFGTGNMPDTPSHGCAPPTGAHSGYDPPYLRAAPPPP